MSEQETLPVPPDWEALPGIGGLAGMSNCDHTIDDGIEEHLRGEPCWTTYAGWNFNGRVWWDAAGEQYACQVWCYHVPVEVIVAPTLEDLMERVSEGYGYE